MANNSATICRRAAETHMVFLNFHPPPASSFITASPVSAAFPLSSASFYLFLALKCSILCCFGLIWPEKANSDLFAADLHSHSFPFPWQSQCCCISVRPVHQKSQHWLPRGKGGLRCRIICPKKHLFKSCFVIWREPKIRGGIGNWTQVIAQSL